MDHIAEVKKLKMTVGQKIYVSKRKLKGKGKNILILKRKCKTTKKMLDRLQTIYDDELSELSKGPNYRIVRTKSLLDRLQVIYDAEFKFIKDYDENDLRKKTPRRIILK